MIITAEYILFKSFFFFYELLFTNEWHMNWTVRIDQSERCPCDTDPMTTEYLLHHCPLHDDARQETWPEPVPLKEKLYGNLGELWKTVSFVRAVGVSIWVYKEEEEEWGNMKANICKHSLGMEIRLGISEPPAEAKSVPLGMKRKRGRPKLSKPALLRQWGGDQNCKWSFRMTRISSDFSIWHQLVAYRMGFESFFCLL